MTRIYAGIAVTSALAYAVASALITEAAAIVCIVAALTGFCSAAMLGVELIWSWQRDRSGT